MKIKGWEKINGFTYKGYCIVNPSYSVGNVGKYYADVLDLNTPNKTKWELSVLMPDFKFKQDNDITIILWDENKYRATKSISPAFISEIKGFRMIFEDLVNEVLKLRLISATRTAGSHSLSGAYSKPINNNFYGTATITNTGGGILNTITANSNTIAWDPNANTNLPSSMLIAIKDLQKQIDNLKNI